MYCNNEECEKEIKICDKHKAEVLAIWSKVIPIRYKCAKLGDFDSSIVKEVHEYLSLDNKEGLYLFGNVGCGKTHLKWAVIKNLIETTKIIRQLQKPPFYEYDCKDLTYSFHSYYTGRGNTDLVSYIKSFIKYNTILILDDFGHGETTRDTFSVNMWNMLIDEIYNACGSIVFISNYNIDKLSGLVGDYATDRIKQMCKNKFIELTGKSIR